MRQYITVERNKDGLKAKIVQVESGLFGESKHTEDEISGSQALVRIYLQANYPTLEVELGSELLKD